MQVIYYDDNMPYKFSKSLFLAGPSLRAGQEGTSWRKDALQILQDIGYDGIVFCPETRDGVFDENVDHEKIIGWEDQYLNIADVIVFWVPRDLSFDKNGTLKLPGLTTNVEFGRYENSGKIVFGAPEDAEKVSYLKHYAEKYSVPVCSTLTETLEVALKRIGEGAERSLGERYIPLHLWNNSSFQDWYQSQTKAGNRLETAQLLYTFRPNHKDIFLWILKVNVWINSEQRFKSNEFVLSRSDISSVLMWKPHEDLMQSEIVLVREFRSPAVTEDGFIHELPSGSSRKDMEPKENALHEIQEETGIVIDQSRLQFHEARQLAGTLSAHKSHLYSVKLTEEEISWLKSQKNVSRGVEKDSEKTWIEVMELRDILKNEFVDWSNLGEILSVVFALRN